MGHAVVVRLLDIDLLDADAGIPLSYNREASILTSFF